MYMSSSYFSNKQYTVYGLRPVLFTAQFYFAYFTSGVIPRVGFLWSKKGTWKSTLSWKETNRIQKLYVVFVELDNYKFNTQVVLTISNVRAILNIHISLSSIHIKSAPDDYFCYFSIITVVRTIKLEICFLELQMFELFLKQINLWLREKQRILYRLSNNSLPAQLLRNRFRYCNDTFP